jgi:hypothetical protein
VKGIVFNLLEETVTEEFGLDAWDSLLDIARLDGAYTSLGSYPDGELIDLVAAASTALGKTPAQILRWFGRHSMPYLARRYPAFFEAQHTGRDFILSVNSIIHPEVRKLYAGAGCPHFHFRETSIGTLIIGYQSPRKLCDLAQGFIEGAADRYGEEVAVEHLACMNRGDHSCQIAVAWVS